MSFKFRRQYIIGPFVADFCCLEKRLVIELDGGQHAEQVERDFERAQYMATRGFETIRFWNSEVLRDPREVIEKVYEKLCEIDRKMTDRKRKLYGWGR